jgi:hypothetical protein
MLRYVTALVISVSYYGATAVSFCVLVGSFPLFFSLICGSASQEDGEIGSSSKWQ